MFVEAFQYGLRKGHFNESLSHRPMASLAEVVTYVEWYIKGEERNIENKVIDVKRTTNNIDNSQQSCKNHYISTVRDKEKFKWRGKTIESLTPLNTRCDELWREVLHMHAIFLPPFPNLGAMGSEPRTWCKFHKVRGQYTKYCYQLKKETYCII